MAQTTEERIREIAEGFGKGIENYRAGQERKERGKMAADAQLARAESDKRKRAMELAKFSSDTGIDPATAEAYLASGDTGLLSRALKSGGAPKAMVAAKKESPRDQSEQELKLGVEGKRLVGIANEGLNAVMGMQDSMSQGFGPRRLDPSTPIIGTLMSDDPFSVNQRIAAEMFGRLQSGGAISKPEEERFVAMGPRPGDSQEIAQQKLEAQRAALEDRLRIIGATPEVLASMGVQRRPSAPTQQSSQGISQAPRLPDKLPSGKPVPKTIAGVPTQDVGNLSTEQLMKMRQELASKNSQMGGSPASRTGMNNGK